jgi:hypothetical protein
VASRSARAVAAALPTYLVSTAVAVAVNFATDSWRTPTLWLIVAGLVLVSAIVATLTVGGQDRAEPDHRAPPNTAWPQPQPYGNAGYPGHYQSRPPRSRGVAGGVAALVVIAVLVASVVGVQYVFGLVTGRESGVERLGVATSATTGALTLTVDSVEVTAHFTRVGMTAVNDGSDALSLPVYSNCQLTAAGTTAAGDPFASQWPDSVPPETSVSGVVVFRSVIPGGTTEATVSFSTIYGSLSTRGSIVVRKVPLRAAAS